MRVSVPRRWTWFHPPHGLCKTNAAWLRLNVIRYNLLSAYKHVGLPEEFHTARPKRLRFLLLKEALGRSSRFETLHLALSSPHRLM